MFKDPLTGEVMKEAVMATCGHSFGKEAIQQWLQSSSSCPVCKIMVLFSLSFFFFFSSFFPFFLFFPFLIFDFFWGIIFFFMKERMISFFFSFPIFSLFLIPFSLSWFSLFRLNKKISDPISVFNRFLSFLSLLIFVSLSKKHFSSHLFLSLSSI